MIVLIRVLCSSLGRVELFGHSELSLGIFMLVM